MFCLEIGFPSHRYHATPWGNHVNEGLVEWPASPWRIARAFYSVGFTHLGWREAPPSEFAELIESIAHSPPAFRLPSSETTHSRHYMPVSGTTSKVLDTCRRISDDETMLVRFDTMLSDGTHQLLQQLAEHTSYLGRAESWVDMSLLNDVPDELDWCLPSQSSMPRIGATPTRVLVPIREMEYQSWRDESVAERLAGFEQPTKSQRSKAAQPYPASVEECLAVDTDFLTKHGWSQPPGTRWVEYLVESSSPSIRNRKRSVTTSGPLPTTAIVSLTSDSVSGRTLPPIARSLFVAEAMHGAAIDRFTKRSDLLSYALSGKMNGGERNQHRHAHFLPLDLDCDQKLDHLVVHCPDGLDFSTQSAIASIGRIYSQQLPEIAVTWVGCGSVDVVRLHIKGIAKHPSRLFQSAKRFRSLTPYVASRFLRRKYQLRENIVDECRFRNLPKPVDVDVIGPNGGRFRLARIQDKRRPPVEHGQFLTIEFPEPIQGPLTLGYASHFGLGMFEAVAEP